MKNEIHIEWLEWRYYINELKRKGSKCYWIKKQIQQLHVHPWIVSPVLIWWILDAFFLHFSTTTLYKPNVTMTSKKSISPLNTKWPSVCWYHVLLYIELCFSLFYTCISNFNIMLIQTWSPIRKEKRQNKVLLISIFLLEIFITNIQHGPCHSSISLIQFIVLFLLQSMPFFNIFNTVHRLVPVTFDISFKRHPFKFCSWHLRWYIWCPDLDLQVTLTT